MRALIASSRQLFMQFRQCLHSLFSFSDSFPALHCCLTWHSDFIWLNSVIYSKPMLCSVNLCSVCLLQSILKMITFSFCFFWFLIWLVLDFFWLIFLIQQFIWGTWKLVVQVRKRNSRMRLILHFPFHFRSFFCWLISLYFNSLKKDKIITRSISIKLLWRSVNLMISEMISRNQLEDTRLLCQLKFGRRIARKILRMNSKIEA